MVADGGELAAVVLLGSGTGAADMIITAARLARSRSTTVAPDTAAYSNRAASPAP